MIRFSAKKVKRAIPKGVNKEGGINQVSSRARRAETFLFDKMLSFMYILNGCAQRRTNYALG